MELDWRDNREGYASEEHIRCAMEAKIAGAARRGRGEGSA